MAVLFPVLVLAQATGLGTTTTASLACLEDSVTNCISSAVIEVCGIINDTTCICNTAGQASIATAAAPCLFQICPYNFLLSLASTAGAGCEEWLSTHTLTGSALLSAQSAANASITTSSPTLTSGSRLSFTATPTPSAPSETSTSSPAALAAGLPLGAGVGIGVGAFAIVVGAIVGIILCRRHKQRAARARAAAASSTDVCATELAADGELAAKRQRMSAVGIPLQELEGFRFPFQQGAGAPVEADSRSLRSMRSGQPRGRMAGTETTAFDFETQKVLVTPDIVRTPGSRAASVVTTDSGGRRTHHAGTAGPSSSRPGTAASGREGVQARE